MEDNDQYSLINQIDIEEYDPYYAEENNIVSARAMKSHSPMRMQGASSLYGVPHLMR